MRKGKGWKRQLSLFISNAWGVKHCKRKQERDKNHRSVLATRKFAHHHCSHFGFPWWQVWKKDGRIRRIMEMGKNVKPCDGDEDSDEDQDDGVVDGDGDADVHNSKFYSHIGYIRDMVFLLAAAGDTQGGQQVQGNGGGRQGFDQTYDLQHFAIGTRKV